jgi:DNA-directed RNA polymerase specialized sigma24 family protein
MRKMLFRKLILKRFGTRQDFEAHDGGAWLLAIVRNTCCDRLKQSGVRDNIASDERIHSVDRSTINLRPRCSRRRMLN